MRGHIVGIMSLAALAACDAFQGQRLQSGFEGLPPPPGTAVLRDAVDQMIVGDRLMEAGEFELALRAYYRAAAENGTDAVTLMAIGSASLALGRLGQAETTLRSAVDLAPNEPVAWNNLGVVLMEQGNYGEARQVFQRAFALDSGRSDAIRENLQLAIARMEDSAYTPPEQNETRFDLERRGGGRYILTGS
ncbi:MAG: tetratricopeptide repeat protein [Pseudomonadota bacterium]